LELSFSLEYTAIKDCDGFAKIHAIFEPARANLVMVKSRTTRKGNIPTKLVFGSLKDLHKILD